MKSGKNTAKNQEPFQFLKDELIISEELFHHIIMKELEPEFFHWIIRKQEIQSYTIETHYF